MCSTIGATTMPLATRSVITSAVSTRPADGISAEPGSRANELVYAVIGHESGT